MNTLVWQHKLDPHRFGGLLGPDGQPLPEPEPRFTAQIQELIDHAYDSLPADVRRRAERALASIARLNGILARHFYLEGWHGGFW